MKTESEPKLQQKPTLSPTKPDFIEQGKEKNEPENNEQSNATRIGEANATSHAYINHWKNRIR